LTQADETPSALRNCQAKKKAPIRGESGPFGAKGQNRTADTAVFSRVLYQLSYLGK
jgi:hypothetical protein